MVVNLLSNAVKFTPAGGQIKIDARIASRSEHRSRGSSDANNGSADDVQHPTDDLADNGENHHGKTSTSHVGGTTASTTNNVPSPVGKRLSFSRAIRAFADSSMGWASSSTGSNDEVTNGGQGCDGGDGKRSSFNNTAVHNSNSFGIDNNFNNGLVVDLDGSDGLLASLGKDQPGQHTMTSGPMIYHVPCLC